MGHHPSERHPASQAELAWREVQSPNAQPSGPRGTRGHPAFCRIPFRESLLRQIVYPYAVSGVA